MKHAAVLMMLEGAHKIVPLEDEVIQTFVTCFCIVCLFVGLYCKRMSFVCKITLLLNGIFFLFLLLVLQIYLS